MLKPNPMWSRFLPTLPMILVEVNGYHHALHVYANPARNFEIDKQDPKIHYFGPGLLPGDTIPIDKNTSFKDYDKFIRDNIYYGDIEFNARNNATFYLSGYDDKHLVENIHINDYYINGRKVTDLGTVGKNAFVKGIFLE